MTRKEEQARFSLWCDRKRGEVALIGLVSGRAIQHIAERVTWRPGGLVTPNEVRAQLTAPRISSAEEAEGRS